MRRRLRETTLGPFRLLRESSRPLPKYPPDHQLGMVVPEGGSNCAKCEYLNGPKTCGNRVFIAWEGKSKPAGTNVIPIRIDRYCCDMFETSPKLKGKKHGR